MSKVSQRIQEVADWKAAEQAAKQQAQEEVNAKRRAKAAADLAVLFGEMNEELTGCILESEEELQCGVLSGVAWQIGSHEEELAPTLIRWRPEKRLGFEVNAFSVTVAGEKEHYFRDVVPAEFGDVLLTMRNEYAPWRANVAARIQKVAAAERARLARAAAQKEYEVKLDAWREECRVWAETETARLWEPWHVWKIRYVAYDAFFAAAAAEEETPIETIYTLDEPGDMVESMRPVALVDMVDWYGKVTPDFALATFLDGVRVDYGEPTIEKMLLHHRSHNAGGFYVNVPAHVLAEPVAAPKMPEKDEGEE